jgi:hypothetical protein
MSRGAAARGEAKVGDVEPPAPLAAGRLVRLRVGGVWQQGRVVAARQRAPGAAEELTVRVQTGEQVRFAIVPRTAVEPVEAAAREVLDQARAALRAGDQVLAALWLANHVERAGDADPETAAAAAALAAGLGG